MFQKRQISQGLCSSGVRLSFSGVPVSTHKNYEVSFWTDSCIPLLSEIIINPTGYNIRPSTTGISGITYVQANTAYTEDNSLSAVIGMKIIDTNSSTEIYRDYIHLSCGNLCSDSGQPRNTALPTRTPTPTTSPTPTPSETATPTPTVTPSISVTPTNSSTPSPTPTESPTPSITASRSPTPTRTPTKSITPTATNTVTPSPTHSQTPTNTSTPTNTPTQTPTLSITPTASQTSTPAPTPGITRTPTPTPTITPSITPTITNTLSITPTVSITASATPTPTRTPTRTVTKTPTPTKSNTPEPTPTPTVSISATPTMTPLNNPPTFSIVFNQLSFLGNCQNGILVEAMVYGLPNTLYTYNFNIESIDDITTIFSPNNGQFAMSNNSAKIFTTVYSNKKTPFVISCAVSDGINTLEALTTVECKT